MYLVNSVEILEQELALQMQLTEEQEAQVETQ